MPNALFFQLYIQYTTTSVSLLRWEWPPIKITPAQQYSPCGSFLLTDRGKKKGYVVYLRKCSRNRYFVRYKTQGTGKQSAAGWWGHKVAGSWLLSCSSMFPQVITPAVLNEQHILKPSLVLPWCGMSRKMEKIQNLPSWHFPRREFCSTCNYFNDRFTLVSIRYCFYSNNSYTGTW